MRGNTFQIYICRADCLDALGEHARAVASCDEALRLRPRSADVLERRGISRTKLGEYDLALADFTASIRISPGEARAWCNRANTYLQMKRYREALADIDHAIQLAPTVAEFKGFRELIASTQKGEPNFDPLIAQAALPAGAAVLSEASRIANDAAKDGPAETLRKLDGLIDRFPASLVAVSFRAMVRASQKDEQGALADVDRALKLKPDFVDGLALRAGVLRSMGRAEDGLVDLYHALNIDPQNGSALGVRAGLLLDLGEHDGAIADASRGLDRLAATKDRPPANDSKNSIVTPGPGPRFREGVIFKLDPIDVLATRAEAYQQKGDLDRALADADRVHGLLRDRPDWRYYAHHLRSEMLMDKGELDNARDAARKALETARDDDEKAEDRDHLDEIAVRVREFSKVMY